MGNYIRPDLVIEVLSPGSRNRRRDREAKLKLYSRRGVLEYWIVDWQTCSIKVYRQQDEQLAGMTTWAKSNLLESPLLQGFSARVEDLFTGLP